MKNLLIDVGSTFIKYCVFDTSLKQELCFDKISFPDALLDDGVHYIVSSQKIMEAIRLIFQKTKQFGCKNAYFSVQMHGYLLQRDGEEVTEYVSWRDKSGDIEKKELAGIDFDQFGTALKLNLPLTKLDAMKGCKEFFTLGSYISWTLTGNNMTHISDACPSGFYFSKDGSTNEFCQEMKMPIATMDVKPVGIYDNVVIFTPIGDHQISFLGSHAAEDYYLLNIGTATQISCVGDSGHEGLCEKRPYFNGKILYTLSGLTGGYLLNEVEYREKLMQEIVQLIGNVPSKKGMLLGGGGAPFMYEYLQEKGIDLDFKLIEHNIGMEGLKMIANQNSTKIGTMLSEISFPNFPIIAKNSGLDFMIIDAEHGAYDYAELSRLIMTFDLIDFNTIIRIGDASRANVTKLADSGAHGFLLPMTNTANDIQAIVDFAKYAPVGKRGISTTRPHTFYNPPALKDYMVIANEKMQIFAQIETKAGVSNIEEILAVNGVTGVLIGPNDLSCDLDCIGDKAPILSCIEKVAKAANNANKPWGIITADKDYLALAKKLGANFVSIGSELNMLISGCKNLIDRF